MLQRWNENLPNGSSLILCAYKGQNIYHYVGHTFNVIEDENGVIKFLDLQQGEYGEGIKALADKMRKHGLIDRSVNEVNKWIFYNGNEFLK